MVLGDPPGQGDNNTMNMYDVTNDIYQHMVYRGPKCTKNPELRNT